VEAIFLRVVGLVLRGSRPCLYDGSTSQIEQLVNERYARSTCLVSRQQNLSASGHEAD
jgi:hypothetical protein